MKKIFCDICNKELTKEEGIHIISLDKVDVLSFESYPDSYDSFMIIKKDICIDCKEKIKEFVEGMK
jgi:hypothetical protein